MVGYLISHDGPLEYVVRLPAGRVFIPFHMAVPISRFPTSTATTSQESGHGGRGRSKVGKSEAAAIEAAPLTDLYTKLAEEERKLEMLRAAVYDALDLDPDDVGEGDPWDHALSEIEEHRCLLKLEPSGPPEGIPERKIAVGEQDSARRQPLPGERGRPLLSVGDDVLVCDDTPSDRVISIPTMPPRFLGGIQYKVCLRDHAWISTAKLQRMIELEAGRDS